MMTEIRDIKPFVDCYLSKSWSAAAMGRERRERSRGPTERPPPCFFREKFLELIGKNSSRVRRDELAYPRCSCGSDFPGIFSHRPKSLQCVPKTFDSWRIGQEARYTVLDDFGVARHIGCDNWPPTQHGFNYRQGQTL